MALFELFTLIIGFILSVVCIKYFRCNLSILLTLIIGAALSMVCIKSFMCNLLILPTLITIALTMIYINSARSNLVIKNKNILIIGGSSGLGLSIAKILYNQGNKITITSRNQEKIQNIASTFPKSEISTVYGMAVDVTADNNLNLTPDKNKMSSYDYIFYCAGISHPGYFKDQNSKNFIHQNDLNFIGMIKTLYFFKNLINKPFVFVVISSTVSFFGFPGYSSYSPSKASITSFFKAVRLELLDEKITMKVVYPCAMDTPSLHKENLVKPEFTTEIELGNKILTPDFCASFILKNLHLRNSIAMDWFTFFLMIRDECEMPLDYLIFPLSVLIVFIGRIYINIKYQRRKT